MKRGLLSKLAYLLSDLFCVKTSMHVSDAKRILHSFSPKPVGLCYTNNRVSIDYELQIIIPAYNVDQFVEKCLESLSPILLSKRKILIQIVDDGSNDDTGIIIERFANKYGKNISFIRQKNQGLSSARNAALKTIRGEYVLFLDSDDYLSTDFSVDSILEEAKGYDILQLDWSVVDKEGKECRRVFFNGISGFPWGKLYHYSFIKHFQFPDGYWFEDTPLKFILGGIRCKYINHHEYAYCYRINPQGITMQSKYAPKAVDSYWITELCLEQFPFFGVKYDDRAYEFFLSQSILNYQRILKCPRSIRKAVFVMMADLADIYFPCLQSKKKREIDNAIRKRQFMKFGFLSVSKMLRDS